MENFRRLCKTFGLDCNKLPKPFSDVDRRVSAQQDSMRKMLYDESYCDVVFLCADGVRVHAVRLLVCAGCTMLRKKLMGGNKKSSWKEVYSLQLNSTVLRVVLEFLYFGAFPLHKESCTRKQWNEGLSILEAAQCLELLNLESLVWEALLSDVSQSLSRSENQIQNCAIRLSAITDFQPQSRIPKAAEENLQVVTCALGSSMSKRWWTEGELRHMSRNAMLFWLQKVRNDTTVGVSSIKKIRIDVYLRLRQVLVWCVCQTHEFAEHVVSLHLPSVNGVLRLIRSHNSGEAVQLGALLEPKLKFEVDVLQKACLAATFEESFLHLLDIHLLHPVLLLKVIEPVGIISSLDQMLLTVLRDHTLNGGLYTSKSAKPAWEADDCFRTSEDGSVLELLDYEEGWATAVTPMSGIYGTYEWDLIFQHWCNEEEISCEMSCNNPWENCWGLGIVQVHEKVDSEALMGCTGRATTWSRDWKCQWWLLRMTEKGILRTFKVHDWKARHSNRGTAYGSYHELLSCFDIKRIKFRVSFDMERRTCSFSINGNSLGQAWEGIPEGTYYPFISFHPSKQAQQVAKKQKLEKRRIGTVRLKLVSGFNEKWI